MQVTTKLYLRQVWTLRVEYENPDQRPVQINCTLDELKQLIPAFIYAAVLQLHHQEVVIITVSAFSGSWAFFSITKKGLC